MSYAGIFTDKNNVDHPVTAVLYGTCATATDTAAKVVTCTDFDTLMTGVTIRVKFTYRNTAQSPTLNINNTGAKAVYRFGSVAPVNDDSWEDGAVVELVYDGTSFFMVNSDDIGNLYNSLDNKQPKTDNNLQTTAKTVVGAINELNTGVDTLDDWTDADTKSATGNPITINDAAALNAKWLVMSAAPIQDLHGYSKPWTGGAGKNKAKPFVRNTYGTKVEFDEPTGTITASGTSNESGLGSGVVWEGMLPAGTYILSGNGFDSSLKVYSGWDWISDMTSSGATFTISSAVTIRVARYLNSGMSLSYNITEFMIRLASVADATFEPYENICPISGISSAEVETEGKNLVYKVLDNANIETTGLIKSQENYNLAVAKIKNGKTYTIKTDDASGFVGGFFLTDPVVGSVSYDGQRIISNNKTFTSSIDGYVVFRTSSSYTQAQIEVGEQSTDYTPYTGDNTATISLGGTVYGGTVDFNTGVLTVTHALVDLGTLTWTKYESYGNVPERFAVEVSGIKNDCECICDSYLGVDVQDLTLDSNYVATIGGNYINVVDKRYSDAASFTTAVDGVQLVYELATPTTTQLTPAQLELLKGYNTVTANGASISLVYQPENLKGDILEEVGEQIAPIETRVASAETAINGLKYHKIAESASTGTYADKLQSLASAYNALSFAERRSAIMIINGVDIYQAVNVSGNFFTCWVDSSNVYVSRYGIDGSAYTTAGVTVVDNSSVENINVFELWVCEP